MAVLIVFAACYGVWQLAMVGSSTRTVRIAVLLLAVAVGLYGSGVLCITLQLAYTHGVASLTGKPFAAVVRTASYTVDPLIEEIGKIAPLFLVALLHRRVRTQFGLTDYLLVGAATGSGFSMTEALLRYTNEARAMHGVPGGLMSGWAEPYGGFTVIYFPGLSRLLGSWVPEPVAVGGGPFGGLPSVAVNSHAMWSALTGLAVGLLLRPGWPRRWIWPLRGTAAVLFLFAWLDHASFNQRAGAPGDHSVIGSLSGAMQSLHGGLWVYPLLALLFASALDRRAVRDNRAAFPDLDAAGLTGFSARRPPWTQLIMWRFVQLRRSLLYARAAGADVSVLHEELRRIRADMIAANSAEAWRGVGRVRLRPAPEDSAPGDAGVAAGPRSLSRYRPLAIWLVMLLPSALYFAVGTFPGAAGVQRFLESAALRPVFVVITVAGLGWTLWNVARAVRALPGVRAPADADSVARADLRLIVGVGSVLVGVACLLLALAGTGIDQHVLPGAHILDALGKLLLIVGLLLALLGLFFFPPFALMVTSAGELVLVSTVTAQLGTALASGGALGALGIILMMAAARGGGGGRGGGRGGGDGTPGNNQAQNRQFRDAVQEAERELGRQLSKDEIRQVHDEITGQNMGFHEIVDTILGMFGR